MTRARPRPILWFQPPPGSLLAALLLLCLNLLGPLPAWGQEEGDPPGRVGRIAQREGPVRWFDQEEQRWDDAQLNLPLTQGDRVVTEAGGRAELRIGSTLLIVDEASELAFDRLDDDELRVRVLRGRVALRLRSDEIAREVAFGSDDAWLRPLRAGLYGLQREGAMTEATSWRGQLQLDDGSRLIVDAGRRVQLWRADSELRLRLAAIEDDAFASRVRAADRDEERAAAATRHVSPEMTGWEDLGRYGRWDQHPEYGAVWASTAVAVDWAPYRDGRWVWLRPWGWTWVDAAPWGFAPFHYGRWMRWHARWVWVPGPVVARPVFAPALVAWIDAPAVGIGIRLGNVSFSWMPLAPWEPYRPAYHASPRYFTRVDPPEWRRHRPPPGWQGGIHYGRDGLPHGVTVVPADVLRRPPPHGAHRADPPRPLLPGRPHERPPRFGEPDRGHGHGDERGFDGGPQRPPRADERAPERRLPPIGGPQEAPVLIHPPVMSGPGARVPRVHRDEPESALRPGGGREPARPVQPVQPVQPESPRAPQAPIFTPAPSEGRQRIPERASPQPRRLPPEVESRSRDDEVPQRPERRGSVR